MRGSVALAQAPPMLSAKSNLIGAAKPAGHAPLTLKALNSQIVEATLQFRSVVDSANLLPAKSKAQKAWAEKCCKKAWYLSVVIDQLRARPKKDMLAKSTCMRIEAALSEAHRLLGAMPTLRNYIQRLNHQLSGKSDASPSSCNLGAIEGSALEQTPATQAAAAQIAAVPANFPCLVCPALPAGLAVPITPPYGQMGLPPVAIRSIGQNIRFKWFRDIYASKGFGQVRLSTLVTQTGQLTLTPAFTYGSFGKIHYGIDSEQQIHIVKEWHLGVGTSRPKGDKVFTCCRADAVAEIERTVFLRRVIDQTNVMHDLANPPLFKDIRIGSLVFDLKSCDSAAYIDETTGVYKERMYAVMTRDAGNLFDLDYHLSPSLRPAAAMSLAAQGFVELEALHNRAHYGHFDISMGNIFYNGFGQFKLMDFGMALNLHKMTSSITGLMGSVAAPEMVLMPADKSVRPFLTASVDVFALAVVVANILNGSSFVNNPFRIPAASKDITFAQQKKKLVDVFRAFESWKNDRRFGDENMVQPHAICRRAQDQDVFTKLFAPMATYSPALCALLINRALVADPLQRAPSSELAYKIVSLLPTLSVDEKNHLQSSMYFAAQRVRYIEPRGKQADSAGFRPLRAPMALPELAARAGHFAATLNLHLSINSLPNALGQ